MVRTKRKTPKETPYRTFVIKPSRVKDKKLIEFLEKKENRNAYIKELIYKDMQQNK